jgi:tetratricopeptide (TPR) repeat protein
MIDSKYILEIHTQGIRLLREGKRRDALEKFQIAMANLFSAVQLIKSSDALLPEKPIEKIDYACSSESIQPFSLSLPVLPATQDKVQEQAHTIFNRALVLPSDGNLNLEQCDMLYGAILYHIGLIYHVHGMELSCDNSLGKALEMYKLALNVIINDMNARPLVNKDINHWLLYAIFNNMANLYYYARVPEMVEYCSQNLRMVLAYSNTNLVSSDDMLFLVLNLDVNSGPGLISASAA